MALAFPVKVHEVPVSVPSAGYQVRISVTFTSGDILNASDATFPTIAQGYYPIAWYANKTMRLWRQWVTDAAGPDPNVSPPGAVTSTLVAASISLSDTPGGSRVTITITDTGCTIAGNPAVISAASLDNTTGWATPLGFEHGVSKSASVAGGVATFVGDFSPRGLFPLPATEDPGLERLIASNRFTNIGGDGTVYFYDAGSSIKVRTYRVNVLSAAFGSPSYPVGYFSSISGDKKTITVAAVDEAVTSASFGAILYDSSLLAAHQWIGVEGVEYPARVKTVGASTLALYEPLSSAPTAGAEIYVLSEADVLDREGARVSGYHLVHSNDDAAGSVKWGAFSAYCRLGKGEAPQALERPTSDPLFSWSWDLAKRRKSGLTLP